MSEDQARALIQTDPEFVSAQRFGNSLSRLEERYPDVCPDNVIAKVLMMSEPEVEARMGLLVEKFRDLMGVDDP